MMGADINVRTRASALDGWARTLARWLSSPSLATGRASIAPREQPR